MTASSLHGADTGALRDRPEQALRESEERYRTLAELSPDATLIAANQHWAYANPAAARLLGAEGPEHVVGRACLDFVAPEYHGLALERMRKTLEERRAGWLMESRWRRLDGEIVDVEVSAAAVPWQGAPAIQVVVRNISERKNAERERDASLARFTALIENIREGVLIETERRSIFGVNAAFCAMFGIPAPPAALLGADCSQAATQARHLLADPERFTRRIDEILAGRVPVAAEEVKFADGRVFERDYVPIVAQSGDFIGHMWRYRDVTDRQKTQAALRASEERYRLLSQASNDVIWDWSYGSGEVVWSDSLRTIFGYDPSEANGPIEKALEWWLGHIHPDQREGVQTHFMAAVQGTDTSWRDEYRFQRADGEYVPVVDIGHIGRGPDGTPTRMVGAMRDVGELERARAEAVAASQAKSRFLSTLSHELRTPLTAVIGVADLLAGDVWGSLNPQQRQNIARIKASAWHLVSIIDEILIFTRSEAGKEEVHLDEVDVSSIAREVVDLLSGEAQARGLELGLRGRPAALVIRTDGGKVRQILVNLVGNALKYTDHGQVQVELTDHDAKLEVAVHDSGPGIPEERLEDIFEPFVQVDGSMTRTKGGAGLGLTICRRLARMLGGDVTVTSRIGEGSTFTLVLPKEETPPAAGAADRANTH